MSSATVAACPELHRENACPSGPPPDWQEQFLRMLPAIRRQVRFAFLHLSADDRDWNREPLHAIIDHIVATYHDPLREELPRLESMAAKVWRVHGTKMPELARIDAVVTELSAELRAHMRKEEGVLFPAIVAIEGGQGSAMPISAPIGVMEHEHDHAGALLSELRTITAGYATRSTYNEGFIGGNSAIRGSKTSAGTVLNMGIRLQSDAANSVIMLGPNNLEDATTRVSDAGPDSRIRLEANKIGFFSSAPVVRPTVTGSRGGNAALADLLTELATLGLIIDSSTA